MKLIAHRGNVFGRSDHENSPKYLLSALNMGFDVEIDVRVLNNDTKNEIWLGHDNPQFLVSHSFLHEHSSKLWCHAKNFKALNWLIENNFHAFWHQEDDFTLTTKSYIWTYPNRCLPHNSRSVIVCKTFEEQSNFTFQSEIHGICSDFVGSMNGDGSW